ncbi:MAG: hypothetical protein PF549_03305, partial [Patescibacteria group bacterium]|nr:hypothetical protein [Patescibacteria group bacterium]
IEYSYSRKMRHKDQKITMAIERTLFDETGFPEGGEIAAKYKDGKWVEFDSDIPVISEEDAEVLKASKAEKKKNEETRKPPEDCMPRLTEIKGLLTNFENIHDLEALHAINHLTMKTALDYPEREAAKADLIPIFSLINYLEEKTDITKEKLKELKLQFRKISQAVGIITEKEGILDHTRVAFKES